MIFRSSLLIFATAVLLLHPSQSTLAQDQFEVDNSHTSVVFAVSHFNLSYTYGRFNKTSGSFQLDRDNPNNSSFSFVIDAASIDTNDEARDDHLRGEQFFETETFPQIKFTSTSVSYEDNVYSLTGDFTMHGVTREVTMDLKVVGEGQGPFGKTRAGFFSKFNLVRSEFGMDQMLKGIGDNIAISFSFEGIKQ